MKVVMIFRVLFVSIVILTPSTLAAKVKVNSLKIKNEVVTWQEQKESFSRFTANKLFELIDGGATEYVQQGLIEGIHQQFTDGQGKTVEIFVEDFGNDEKAVSMVNEKKGGFTEVQKLAGDTSSSILASKAIGGLVVILPLKNFYVEMVVSGFTEEGSADKAALQFINFYRSKIK